MAVFAIRAYHGQVSIPELQSKTGRCLGIRPRRELDAGLRVAVKTNRSARQGDERPAVTRPNPSQIEIDAQGTVAASARLDQSTRVSGSRNQSCDTNSRWSSDEPSATLNHGLVLS